MSDIAFITCIQTVNRNNTRSKFQSEHTYGLLKGVIERRQETVPGGGMPGGVSNTSGDAGALCAPARPRRRGYTGGGQPPPTTVPPVRVHS